MSSRLSIELFGAEERAEWDTDEEEAGDELGFSFLKSEPSSYALKSWGRGERKTSESRWGAAPSSA